jgi:homoserine dehydrogenase
MKDNKTFKIGLAGMGIVGGGTYKILVENEKNISRKMGVKYEITKIAANNINKALGVYVNPEIVTNNWEDLVNDEEVDLVIELMGGEEPARTLIEKALSKKKHVVTANKMVIAKYGPELLEIARKNNVQLLCEAAVGGGIPIIRPLKSSLLANNIQAMYGIINGTTNYILTQMVEQGQSFAQALKDAQKLGYAEADPSSDINGDDSAYKLAILSMIAFESPINVKDIYLEGISNVAAVDTMYAEEFGYAIKLLAIAKRRKSGVELRVHPTMIPKGHALASVNGVNNAVYVIGDSVGETMFYGPGAGSSPTASSVVSDVMEIATKRDDINVNRRQVAFANTVKILDHGDIKSEYYLRIVVKDKPGVLADVSRIFADEKVNIKKALQVDEGDQAELIIITHDVKEKQLKTAAKNIKALKTVADIAALIRVGT